MQRTDRFLIGIVVGVIILLVIAFVLALQQPQPSYQPDDTPENVVHNYLLALQKREYERAYSYVSPTLAGYPDSVDQFINDISRNNWQFSNLEEGTSTVMVVSSDETGDRAEVSVRENSYYNRGLFDNYQRQSMFEVRLQREASRWKIIAAEAYWLWCWDDTAGCPGNQ